MKENSIEKDEKILNNIKAYMQENIDIGYHKFIYNDLGYEEKCIDAIKAIEHILSDYKRALKENEIFKEYNMEYKRILDLADNRIYRKKYLEERRKEQPNLLYPDGDEIYQRYYELKQENEQLRTEVNSLRVENGDLRKFIIEGIIVEPDNPYINYQFDFLRENFIPIKKVIDKIKTYENFQKALPNNEEIRIRIISYKELLEKE